MTDFTVSGRQTVKQLQQVQIQAPVFESIRRLDTKVSAELFRQIIVSSGCVARAASRLKFSGEHPHCVKVAVAALPSWHKQAVRLHLHRLMLFQI